MARIAYKEWKERKLEEDRLRRKQERQERRQKMMNAGHNGYHYGYYFLFILFLFSDAPRGRTANNGSEVLLAYGLNKNLKKLRERPQSASGPKKGPKMSRRQQEYV